MVLDFYASINSRQQNSILSKKIPYKKNRTFERITKIFQNVCDLAHCTVTPCSYCSRHSFLCCLIWFDFLIDTRQCIHPFIRFQQINLKLQCIRNNFNGGFPLIVAEVWLLIIEACWSNQSNTIIITFMAAMEPMPAFNFLCQTTVKCAASRHATSIKCIAMALAMHNAFSNPIQFNVLHALNFILMQ